MSSEENQNQGFLNQVANTFLNAGANGTDLTRYATIAGAALVGGAFYYYMNSNRPKPADGIDYKNQTREVEVTNRSGFYSSHSTS
jgi:hypothetical protein